MIRKSSCIFVLTLVVLALVAAVGSIDNNRMIAGNNGVSDNEIVTDMDDMVKYDISIESVNRIRYRERFQAERQVPQRMSVRHLRSLLQKHRQNLRQNLRQSR